MSYISDPDHLERLAHYLMDEPPNWPSYRELVDALKDAAERIRRHQAADRERRWIKADPDDESTWPPVGISFAWMDGQPCDVWRGAGPGVVVTPLRARIMRQWPNRMLGTKDVDPPALWWMPYPDGPIGDPT